MCNLFEMIAMSIFYTRAACYRKINITPPFDTGEVTWIVCFLLSSAFVGPESLVVLGPFGGLPGNVKVP